MLGGNAVTDLQALSGLTYARRLGVRGNRISDFARLTGSEALTVGGQDEQDFHTLQDLDAETDR